MALLSKGSSLISGGIWRRTLARRRRTGRGDGGGALQQVASAPWLAQPLLAQASFGAGCGGGGVSAALQQGACAVSPPGREQPLAAQASSFVGCDALQHVAAGGGSLLPSMLLCLHRSAFDGKSCSSVSNHPQRSRDAVKTLLPLRSAQIWCRLRKTLSLARGAPL